MLLYGNLCFPSDPLPAYMFASTYNYEKETPRES